MTDAYDIITDNPLWLYFDIDRGVVFVNIKVMRPLFCQTVFQFLNSMPAIILLFPPLNTNQVWNNANQFRGC